MKITIIDQHDILISLNNAQLRKRLLELKLIDRASVHNIPIDTSFLDKIKRTPSCHCCEDPSTESSASAAAGSASASNELEALEDLMIYELSTRISFQILYQRQNYVFLLAFMDLLDEIFTRQELTYHDREYHRRHFLCKEALRFLQYIHIHQIRRAMDNRAVLKRFTELGAVLSYCYHCPSITYYAGMHGMHFIEPLLPQRGVAYQQYLKGSDDRHSLINRSVEVAIPRETLTSPAAALSAAQQVEELLLHINLSIDSDDEHDIDFEESASRCSYAGL